MKSPTRDESEPPGRGELLLHNSDLVELLSAVISKGKPFRFQAKGNSMSPFIRDGDVLLLSALDEHGPRCGEVVAALFSGRLVVHRIVARRAGGYVLRGDNNSDEDGLVERDGILAVVTNVERGGSRVRVGLGPERHLIAWLSRASLLNPVLYLPRCIRRRIVRE